MLSVHGCLYRNFEVGTAETDDSVFCVLDVFPLTSSFFPVGKNTLHCEAMKMSCQTMALECQLETAGLPAFFVSVELLFVNLQLELLKLHVAKSWVFLSSDGHVIIMKSGTCHLRKACLVTCVHRKHPLLGGNRCSDQGKISET